MTKRRSPTFGRPPLGSTPDWPGTWRPLPGFPHYAVSDDGRVASARKGRWRLLKGEVDRDGYNRYELVDVEGCPRKVFAHAAVLEAFVGPRPSADSVTRHLDGDPSNNRISNLAWGTAAENCVDRDLHGTTARGPRQGLARVGTDELGGAVLRMWNGERASVVARELGVTPESATAWRGRRIRTRELDEEVLPLDRAPAVPKGFLGDGFLDGNLWLDVGVI